MNADPVDEMRLARRVATGDQSALAELYARYADPLYAFVHHHLDDSEADTEEVWQESLLAALEALPRYRGGSHLFTWLCGIARHKIADYYRRRGAQPVQVLSAVPPERLAGLMDEGPLPEEVVLARSARLGVVQALAALPGDYRRALLARYADGQSVDEVARLLGRSYKATESVLSRARVAFRAALSAVDGEVGNG